MSKRTQIVCIHEGTKGSSIDPVFINSFLKAYNPEWIRPWGTSKVRLVPYGGKTELRLAFPRELKNVLAAGADTTLIVFADTDDELEDGDALKSLYWETAHKEGIEKLDFNKAVFIFSKDRIENWIQYIQTGYTDENKEGPRIYDNSQVRDAARKLAEICLAGSSSDELPVSLKWSCKNWHLLIHRMKS